jgi:hypothetical protein
MRHVFMGAEPARRADRTGQAESTGGAEGLNALTGMRFAGDFETHVTVHCAESESGVLEQWAAARGLRFTHILLCRGRVVSQPMLTLRAGDTSAQVGGPAPASRRRPGRSCPMPLTCRATRLGYGRTSCGSGSSRGAAAGSARGPRGAGSRR